MTTLGVILATSGRVRLADALASLADAGAREGDEVVVVADGTAAHEHARKALAKVDLPCPYVLVKLTPRCNDIGGTPRNVGLGLARADWILYLDDDDRFAPGAFDVVRGKVEGTDWPHVFKMTGPPHGTLWRSTKLFEGNVGGPMFVHPNLGADTPLWDGQRCQDFRFIEDVLERYDGPTWHDEVIYHVRPHEWKGRAYK